MTTTLMAWIQNLPEVGDPIRRKRDGMVAKLNEAYLLERRAAQLVEEARADERELQASIARQWSELEIAHARRGIVECRALALATVRDPGLREGLQALDHHLTASEAVRVFGAADVIQTGTLHSISEPERLAMLDRVIAWWIFAGKPVYERLSTRPR